MSGKEEKPVESPQDDQLQPSEDDLIVDDPGLENIDLTEAFDPSKTEEKSSD